MPENPDRWNNRILGYANVPPEQLLASPMNFRIHPATQQAAMTDMLNTVGWVQAVTISARTGSVLDGHMRVSLALRENLKEIPVLYVDVNEAEERLILAAFDRLGDLAGRDATTLDELLASLLYPVDTNTPLVSAVAAPDLTRLLEDLAPSQQQLDNAPSILLVPPPDEMTPGLPTYSFSGEQVFGAALDELLNTGGVTGEDEPSRQWRAVKVRVPARLRRRWENLFKGLPGQTEAERFENMLERLHA